MTAARTLVCALAIVGTTSVEPAAAAVFDLRAATTTVPLPDGTQVTMWGFGFVGSPVASVPGPVLEVPPGDTTLTINLTNELAVPVSIVIPALPGPLTPVWNDGTTGPRTNLQQRAVSFTHVAQPGQTVTYQWTNVQPGTYLYHSGTHPQVQVPMGLFGAVKHDAVQGHAYDVPYDRDQVLVYSEVDPDLVAAVTSGTYGTASYPTTIGYRPRFFLINGAFATTPPALQITVGERLLLRVVNAGLRTTVPALTGGTLALIGEDGQRAPYLRDSYSMLMPPGKTRDALFVTTEPVETVLFDRRGGRSRFARITAAPAPPVAVADSYATAEDTPLDTAAAALPGVLANDTGSGLAAVLDTPTSNGALMLQPDGAFTYSPAPDFSGVDSFTYHASGGGQHSAAVTVSITVSAVNDAPVAVADSHTATAGSALVVAAPGVLANDTDRDGDALTAQLVQGPSGGALMLAPNGSFQYTPSIGTTQDSFTYRVSDGTAVSGDATVSIAVTARNLAPIARRDFAFVRRNTARMIDVLANDADPDGTLVPTSLAVRRYPTNGTATSLGNGIVRYQPRPNFRGFDWFTYFVRDDDGAPSAVTPVFVLVY